MMETKEKAPAVAAAAIPAGELKWSWSCGIAGIVLLLIYGALTMTRPILEAGGPASLAIAAAAIAGGVAAYGAFRGVEQARFTKPAVLNAVILILITPAVVRAWLITHRSNDALNVRRLTVAVSAYAKEHNGQYPTDLGFVFSRPGITPEIFRRPGSSQTLPKSAEDVRSGSCDYVYLSRNGESDAAAKSPLLCTRPGFLGSWINIGYSDGSIVGVRSDSVEDATGVSGLEPPIPAPLPTMAELKEKRRKSREERNAARHAPKADESKQEEPPSAD